MIRTIEDLAAHLCAANDTEKSIARRVYKSTSCGCPAGVEVSEAGEIAFWVAGYCEGSDAEHPRYTVPFPCTKEQIDDAVDRAEKDGEDTWNATHGCDKCNTTDEGFGKPVDPYCPSCEGHGII